MDGGRLGTPRLLLRATAAAAVTAVIAPVNDFIAANSLRLTLALAALLVASAGVAWRRNRAATA